MLIVTDGAEATRSLAERIGAELRGMQVRILSAADFHATDMLPADMCFFGAEEPCPVFYAPVEAVLAHINLAGRRGGVFSPRSKAAVQYLSSIVHDSELALYAQPFLGDQSGDMRAWIKNCI
ncbi:hypothetical protein FACS1894142_8240 [Spirochaetia bacterium]|nr:hypothetical protein FACS1894142_8240 [Spirochaetia bacterium]